jgi:hypothetical protein
MKRPGGVRTTKIEMSIPALDFPSNSAAVAVNSRSARS